MIDGAPEASALCRWRVGKARNIADLRAVARARLPRGIFDFMDGGAEDETTLGENAAAYGRLTLLPRVLRDVSAIDTGHDILGGLSRLPFAMGPTGGVGFVWPRGDIALARAAERAGIPFAMSTTASVSIEELRESSGGRLWFQSYIFRDAAFTDRLIRRAEAAEYEALIITVDLPVGGNRERDARNDFSVPFRFTPRNVLDFALHPRWVGTTLRHGKPEFGNLRDFTPSSEASEVASSVGRNYDARFDWDGLARIRDTWPSKLIVKGILHPDDAARLASMGVDAIVVSNHGGRQLDGAPATLDALVGVRDAVGGRASVLLDGGIRRGTDIVKALATGADAVLLGRATYYGLAAGGEAGVTRALDILALELKRAMALCGARSVRELDSSFLGSAR